MQVIPAASAGDNHKIRDVLRSAWGLEEAHAWQVDSIATLLRARHPHLLLVRRTGVF